MISMLNIVFCLNKYIRVGKIGVFDVWIERMEMFLKLNYGLLDLSKLEVLINCISVII